MNNAENSFQAVLLRRDVLKGAVGVGVASTVAGGLGRSGCMQWGRSPVAMTYCYEQAMLDAGRRPLSATIISVRNDSGIIGE